MQPTCRQVPPRNGSFSTTIVFKPSSPARIAATYPPGPLPMIATSYLGTSHLPSQTAMGSKIAPEPHRGPCQGPTLRQSAYRVPHRYQRDTGEKRHRLGRSGESELSKARIVTAA